MKGLILKPKWADMILNEEKVIEVRSRDTKVRGPIGIIKSGSKKVYGTVTLYSSKPMTKDLFELTKHSHGLTISYDELLEIYTHPYAWFLDSPIKFDKPVEYKHKQGCVIWVNLGDEFNVI